MNHDSTARPADRGRAASIALLVCLALALSTPVAAQQAVPRSEYMQTEIDLGRIDRGEQVTASFEIRNVGEAELRIRNVKPG